MSYFLKIIVAVIFFSTINMLSSCKKETSKNDTCKTDMSHIAGNYKLTAVKYKQNATSSEQNFLPMIDDCEKDDLLTLHADGTYDNNDIGVVCAPGNNSHGSWSVNANRLTSSDSDILEGVIESFDCQSLVYYVSDLYAPGDKLIFTLTKQ